MRRSLAQAANRLLRHVGVKVTQADQPSEFMCHLRRVAERYPVDAVVDVGANAGQFAAQLRDAGFAQPIVSFEPASAAYDALAAAAAADVGWYPLRMALGASARDVTLNVASFSLLSSLHEPNERCGELFGELGRTHAESVVQRRLDEVLPGLSPIDELSRLLLKLDTQGHDLEVLAGAHGCLDRVAVLVIELSFKSIYEDAPTFVDAVSRVHALGFELSGVFPVLQDDALTLYEADAVFVRPALIADETLVGSSRGLSRASESLRTRSRGSLPDPP